MALMSLPFLLRLLFSLSIISMLQGDPSLDQRLYASLTSSDPPYFFIGAIPNHILLIILPSHLFTPRANLNEAYVFELPTASSLNQSVPRLTLSNAQPLSAKYPPFHHKITELQSQLVTEKETLIPYFNCRIGTVKNRTCIVCALVEKTTKGTLWILYNLGDPTVSYYKTYGLACCEKEPDFIAILEESAFYLSEAGQITKFRDEGVSGLSQTGMPFHFCPGDQAMHGYSLPCFKTADARLMSGFISENTENFFFFGRKTRTVWKCPYRGSGTNSPIVRMKAVPVGEFFHVLKVDVHTGSGPTKGGLTSKAAWIISLMLCFIGVVIGGIVVGKTIKKLRRKKVKSEEEGVSRSRVTVSTKSVSAKSTGHRSGSSRKARKSKSGASTRIK